MANGVEVVATAEDALGSIDQSQENLQAERRPESRTPHAGPCRIGPHWSRATRSRKTPSSSP